MSNNKIALTSSMRSNLLSLKNTQALFDSTQNKLSTGYKVNSAMDNPSSYFTAQSLNARADDLNTLLDSIGQAVSTLEVADQGITSLQDLVSQAKSIANNARDTANVSASVTSTIKFNTDALKAQKVTDAVKNAKVGDTMTIRIGDSTSITGKTNVQEDTKLSGINMEDDNMGSLVVDGKEYTLNTKAAEDSMTASFIGAETPASFTVTSGTIVVNSDLSAVSVAENATTEPSGLLKLTAETAAPTAPTDGDEVIYKGADGKFAKATWNDTDSKWKNGSDDVTALITDGNTYASTTATSGTDYQFAAHSDNTTVFTAKDANTLVDGDGNEYAYSAGSLTAGQSYKATDASMNVSSDGKTTISGTFTDAAGAKANAKMGPATINVKEGSTVGDFAKVVENMIGSNKIDVSVEDSNLTIKTLDTTSVEVRDVLDGAGQSTGKGIASALQMDDGITISLDADDTAESLRQKIEKEIPGVSAEINSDGKMVIKSSEGDDLVISGDLAEKLGVSGAATNGNNERAQYAEQFNGVLSQIDQLVSDTSYKGINLLKGDSLTVVFNESRTSTLELKGVTFDSTGLGLVASKGEWKLTADIDESLDQITKATSMLRAQASNFGQNLSTVQIRQDFTENMINELQTGADKLTLADNNEEAANMLALQTRQSLATKSLSLANQSAQAVLQLF
ncbi:MAG: hypothetical protein MJ247_05480 [Alphaproteobacteria bacterium]|nr:hypothetical protein [Alphaproteobacteria bacterium]